MTTHSCPDTVKKQPSGPPREPTCIINHVLVFVAASVRDLCLLPASVASVGLSVHTSMQAAAVRQQKAASVMISSKTFFRVIPVAEVQAGGGPGTATALHGGLAQKPQRCRTGDKKCHRCRCLYIVRAAWRITLAAKCPHHEVTRFSCGPPQVRASCTSKMRAVLKNKWKINTFLPKSL